MSSITVRSTSASVIRYSEARRHICGTGDKRAHPLQLGEDAGAPGDDARQPHQRIEVILPACEEVNSLRHSTQVYTVTFGSRRRFCSASAAANLHPWLQLPHLRSRMLSWIGRSVMRTKTSLAISP